MKKLITTAIITAMIASLASCGKSEAVSDTEYIYGRIDSISGNDVVLLMAEYNDEDTDSEEQDTTAASGSSKRSGKPSGGSSDSSGKRSMPEGFDPSQFSGSMPEGFTKPEGGSSDSSGKRSMPEGFDPSQFSGSMPEGVTKPEGGSSDGSGKRSMPEGFDPSQFGDSMPEGFTKPEGGKEDKSFNLPQSSSKYKFTGEQEEIRIPVGVTVTTDLGVQTDFEVLSDGDMIKCSIEKNSDGQDVVTGVWVMEQ
ncbi:MAG: hypothetical protein J6I47_04190 [Ruminococcus sp.]|nr:hypothetical protein [Ruminococcus sp.]